jgi:hypothetical protein
LLFQLSDTRVVAAIATLEIIVKDPDATVLKTDADITESARDLRTSLFHDRTLAPPEVPFMNYLVADLEIEGIFLSHRSRIAHRSTHFKEPSAPGPPG